MKKKVFQTLVIFVFSFSLTFGQSQDSAVYQLLDALTTEEINIGAHPKKLLVGAEWEALAYWELGARKQVAALSEAVGDLYTFNDDLTFEMKLIDPNDTHKIGLYIKGKYQLEKNKLTMTAKNGKTMKAEIRLLDHNYMVLQMDALRLFFTKSKSYFSYD